MSGNWKETPTDNIFHLEDADVFKCYIKNYVISHSNMTIYASHPNDRGHYKILFGDVAYLSGPVCWTGANFRLGPPDECLRLLRTLEQFDDEPDEELVDDLLGFTMYVVDLPRTSLIVIACQSLTGIDYHPDPFASTES